MKRKILMITVLLFFYTDISLITSNAFADPDEDKAIDELAQKMLSGSDKLKGKRIGLFKFTSMEGKETPEGARVSDSLLERLMGNSSLSFIDRSELHKIIAENELGQTGLIDSSLTQDNGKILPIDFMVTGTFAQIKNEINISARIVNAKTGELYMVKSCRYNSKQTGDTTDSPEAVALYKKSPDILDRVNRVYLNLQKMSDNAPLVFLITVLDRSEMQKLKADKPRLADVLKTRKEKLDQDKPEILKKIKNLRKGLALMKKDFPSRYEEIMKIKNEVINNPPRRR